MFSFTLGSELMRSPIWDLQEFLGLCHAYPLAAVGAIPGGIFVHKVLLNVAGELLTRASLSDLCQDGQRPFQSREEMRPQCV